MSDGSTLRNSTPHESPADKITRNWQELLQELRVVQTGVQILTGFLLTVPFNSRFEQLPSTGKTVFLCVLVGSIIATALLVAPVSLHRLLFRQRQRPWLVTMGHRCAIVGLALLGLTSCGAAYVVFVLVTNQLLATSAASGLLLIFVMLWFVLPAYDHVKRGPNDGQGL